MNGKAVSVALFLIAVVTLLIVQVWPMQPSENAVVTDPTKAARLVISAVLLLAALFVILTRRFKPEDKNWAYGTVGTIVGYWLKSDQPA